MRSVAFDDDDATIVDIKMGVMVLRKECLKFLFLQSFRSNNSISERASGVFVLGVTPTTCGSRQYLIIRAGVPRNKAGEAWLPTKESIHL
jgi:hypothetical protein